jgi:tetratricopeptide (TPR) repeat protein
MEVGAANVPAAAATTGAARALVALRRGDRASALQLATEATAGGGGALARCALGRVRAASGDLIGASHALEAAMVEAPTFLPAKLAWAEVRLDLGDAAAAQTVLVPLVAKAPEDLRARLLLDEASQMLAADPRGPGGAPVKPASAGLQGVCGQNGVQPPYLVAGCALAASSRARFEGDRLRASTQAQEAGRSVQEEPRMLARAAQLLAQQGFVDRAEKLLERATKLAAPQVPSLAWARLAVTLGHGRSATAPPGVRPTNPITRVLTARATFALGGAGALAATLRSYGAPVVERDADLRLLSMITAPGATGTPRLEKPSPAQSYVDGVRARLAGDSLNAADNLSRALAGHADACRAAGEYVAALGTLKRHADSTAFNTLRAENHDCVNLPRQ